MKKILGIGLLLVLLLGGIGYYYTQHDHRNAIRSASPDFTLPASEVFALFEEDEQEANKKLLGKTVAMEGVVSSISSSPEKISISLESGAPIGEVVCELNMNLVESIDQVSEGQVVNIKGECSGKLIDVIFVNCVIE